MRAPARLFLALSLEAFLWASPASAVLEPVSGDEAHDAVQRMTGDASESAADTPETPEPPPAPKKTEFTDADLGPAPTEASLKSMLEGFRGKDGGFDAAKIEALRLQVQKEIDSSSPEKKAMLLKLQEQVNQTVQRYKYKSESMGEKKDEK